MNNNEYSISQSQAAIIAGTSLLLMTVLAGFAYGFVFESLVDFSDAETTVRNIKTSEVLFRFGVFSWVLILILDVLVAWSLYIYFKPVNKSISLLAAWFRLIYSSFLGVSLLGFVVVIQLLDDSFISMFEADQLGSLVLLSLMAFQNIWSIGLIIAGVHLLLLAYLVIKSGYIPKIWAVLLLLASLGYMVTNVGQLVLPQYGDYKATMEAILVVPMIVGEVGFAIWLLWRGARTKGL